MLARSSLGNVKGLLTRHRSVLDNIVNILTKLGYVVSWRVLDMNVHGSVPCRRSRVYIVGMLRPGTGSQPATGASSQPAGCGEGIRDKKGRGVIVLGIVRYVKKKSRSHAL